MRVLKFMTGLTLFAVVLSVILGIFFRYVLKSPLPWVEEFSRLNFIWSTFMGACVATRYKEHLRIRIFSERLRERGQAIHDILVSCLALVFLTVVLWHGPTVYEAMGVQNYAGMPLSQKWQALPIILGSGIMLLYFGVILIGGIRVLWKGRGPA